MQKSSGIQIFHSTEEAHDFLKKGSALTIGNYDGIHLGHRAILKNLFFKAKSLQLKSVVLTFEPHPVKVFAPQIAPKLINTKDQKIELLEKLGIDCVVFQKFDLKFAKTSPETFFLKHLKKNLAAKYITVGYDFTFGEKRKGTIETLEILAYENGIEVDIVDATMLSHILVSSTLIRKYISEGDVKHASDLLERPFFIDGHVIHGHNRGAKLGIHTANLSTDNELLPKDGVYATCVSFENKIYESVTNIGFNPTFENKKRSIETHIFNFDKMIYKKNLRLLFIERLRDEMKFASPQDLIKQIGKDIKNAKKILKKYQENQNG